MKFEWSNDSFGYVCRNAETSDIDILDHDAPQRQPDFRIRPVSGGFLREFGQDDSIRVGSKAPPLKILGHTNHKDSNM